MAAAQAVDMQEERHALGGGTKRVYDDIRRLVPTLKGDMVMFKDIEKVLTLLKTFDNLRHVC